MSYDEWYFLKEERGLFRTNRNTTTCPVAIIQYQYNGIQCVLRWWAKTKSYFYSVWPILSKYFFCVVVPWSRMYYVMLLMARAKINDLKKGSFFTQNVAFSLHFNSADVKDRRNGWCVDGPISTGIQPFFFLKVLLFKQTIFFYLEMHHTNIEHSRNANSAENIHIW